MARCTSSAATAESTPPERPQIDAGVADLRADQLDLLVDHGQRRPRRGRVTRVGEEVLEHVGAARGVPHLGVELHRVQAALGILHRGHRRRGRRRGHAEAVGRAHDRVVVAHPARVDLADVVQEDAAADVELGLPELGGSRARDVAAERVRHRLHPVADAQHGNAELEQARIETWRAVGVDRGRAAGEDESVGLLARTSSGAMSCGTSSERTRHSRTRRAISWAYCAPKSSTSTGRSSSATRASGAALTATSRRPARAATSCPRSAAPART